MVKVDNSVAKYLRYQTIARTIRNTRGFKCTPNFDFASSYLWCFVGNSLMNSNQSNNEPRAVPINYCLVSIFSQRGGGGYFLRHPVLFSN